MNSIPWQIQLKEAVRTVETLQDYAFPFSREVENSFRTLVPSYYLGLIEKNDFNDPIAKMAFASKEESVVFRGKRDPIGDLAHQVAPRLTHRYPNRALLHVTSVCPMYCRFCFRKNLMNEHEPDLYSGDFEAAFAYLEANPQITELILTGGDPWMLGDQKIADLVASISDRLTSVKTLRFHTRMPVTLPDRVTRELVEAIGSSKRLKIVVVTHFNHPRELSTPQVARALAYLRSAGFWLLNQTVLLKGVNDNKQTLTELFLALGDHQIKPYYLHHPDQVAGAEHFCLPLSQGQKLWASLRGEVSGYLLPQYVLDCPAGLGKVPVTSEFVRPLGGNRYVISKNGQEYLYEDL